MTKQEIITVLKYTLGVLGASLGLLLSDFFQTASKELYVLPINFWGRLLGLFFIYLAGAYLVVFLSNKEKPGFSWKEPVIPEE